MSQQQRRAAQCRTVRSSPLSNVFGNLVPAVPAIGPPAFDGWPTVSRCNVKCLLVVLDAAESLNERMMMPSRDGLYVPYAARPAAAIEPK